MITMQQMVDAIAHADEWPDELMRLRQENAELRSQLEVVTARRSGSRRGRISIFK